VVPIVIVDEPLAIRLILFDLVECRLNFAHNYSL
jgi:hypothetical protein